MDRQKHEWTGKDRTSRQPFQHKTCHFISVWILIIKLGWFNGSLISMTGIPILGKVAFVWEHDSECPCVPVLCGPDNA